MEEDLRQEQPCSFNNQISIRKQVVWEFYMSLEGTCLLEKACTKGIRRRCDFGRPMFSI